MLQPERPTAGLDLGAETVVVCAYGLLIPDELLAERSWLNVHPSLLPRWRGAAPVERAIMAGDQTTGVTIHETVHELDAGPVAAVGELPIRPDDDAGAVFARAAELAVDLLDPVLADAEHRLHAAGRDSDLRREDHRRRSPSRPDRSGARCSGRPRALPAHRSTSRAPRATGHRVERAREEGRFVPVEVQPANGRRMAYEAWVRGLR